MGRAETARKVDFLYDNSTLEDDINSWANWATENQHNIAVFRKPEKSPILLIDSNPLTKVISPIEELNSGFLFANYVGDLWHMEAEYLVDFSKSDQPTVPTEIHTHKDWNFYVNKQQQATTSPEEYKRAVQEGIATIQDSELVKVVPSKIKLHHLPNDFSLAKAFVNLCNKYPSAFVSIISTKEFGTWLTATPEILIDVDKHGIFKTMALAGTQKYNHKVALHEVAWVDKDIEEQAMVSRYIINRFKEIRLREFTEKGPMTVRAGNLTHLCTTFNVDTNATDYHDLGGVMLNLLHPTSAVCGMPKAPALELINKIESHDRKFYTGYLGPVNVDNETSLYVNLRCMELFESTANLFAGAGVTAISDPEKEWIETELKFNTLLNIIG